jgi:hypothetical protein
VNTLLLRSWTLTDHSDRYRSENRLSRCDTQGFLFGFPGDIDIDFTRD